MRCTNCKKFILKQPLIAVEYKNRYRRQIQFCSNKCVAEYQNKTGATILT